MKLIKVIVLLLILGGLVVGGIAIKRKWATAGSSGGGAELQSNSPAKSPPVRVEEKYGFTTESAGG